MAPARRGESRMGACETTPTTSHRPGETKPATFRTYLNPRERLFPAPHHRPPLASVKLVRPRPRLPARHCGPFQLDPVRATAQIRSDEEKPHRSPAQPGDRGQGHRVNSPCTLDNRSPHGCGNRHCVATVRGLAAARLFLPSPCQEGVQAVSRSSGVRVWMSAVAPFRDTASSCVSSSEPGSWLRWTMSSARS